MTGSRLSLRALELFQIAARFGSVQAVSGETGLSMSTVSHHLRTLEDHLGVELLNHRKRPMTLTPAGATFLAQIDEALLLIRKAETGVTTRDLKDIRTLRLAAVDDFDSEISPELAGQLTAAMPNCNFSYLTRPSHETLAMVAAQQVDIGIATRRIDNYPELIEYPLVRDPFVVAVPTEHPATPEELIAGQGDLAYIRYSSVQIIRTQIDAHLRRLRINLPSRIELESNQSIIGLVADGSGWTITTPLSYLRAQRFHGRVTLHPFPSRAFSRTLSLFTTPLVPRSAIDYVGTTVRQLIELRAVAPAIRRMPWLDGVFALTPQQEFTPES